MRKTITITDPMQVKPGDKAYFEGCDFGFPVLKADRGDRDLPFMVATPFGDAGGWARSSHFDHAVREVDEPEWPDPHGLRLHVYLGTDGIRYVYNPVEDTDTIPWLIEGYCARHAREEMESYHRDALPLTELKLVPARDDDDE